MRMVAVREHGAVPARERVEPPRKPDGQTLHAARKRGLVFRLDDEVQVVALDGVVDDAHAEALACIAQRLLDHLGPLARAQITDARLQPHGDVNRMPSRKSGSPDVRHSRADKPRMRSGPRPPSTFPFPAAAWELEGHLPSGSLHHIRIADIPQTARTSCRV